MFMYKPCHQDSGNFRSKSLCHFSAAHISNAVQSQVHKGWIAAGQVVLNAIVDQTDQVAVRVHQHWDKQVPLKGEIGTMSFCAILPYRVKTTYCKSNYLHTAKSYSNREFTQTYLHDQWSTSSQFQIMVEYEAKLTICFSVYLLELRRLTASMCPKSISWPKRKMKSSLQTYFFLL